MRSKKVVNIFKQTKLSKFQDVPHPLLLRFQITNIVFVGLNHDGDPLGDGDAVSLQTHNLFGVVGHQAHLPDTQIYQDLRANAIIPQIRLEAQLDIGIHRIHPALLKLIGPDLIDQPDATAFLMHVNNDTLAFLR